MKKYFGNFKIVLLFAAMLALMAFTPSVFPASSSPPGDKPLTWNDGNFPSTIYWVQKADNPWMVNGQSVFSMFKVDDKYYASGEKEIGNDQVFVMAFHNTGSDSPYQLAFDVLPTGLSKEPIKTGLDYDEPVYWGFWDGQNIKQLILTSTYTSRGGEAAIFELTDVVMVVLDNPYWSLNPVWPADTTLKIKTPKTKQALRLYNLAEKGNDGKLFYPKYLLKLQWQVVEGTTTVKNSYNKSKDVYYLNDAQFRFSQADINKGYILVKLYGTPHINSMSADTSKIYKIYWK